MINIPRSHTRKPKTRNLLSSGSLKRAFQGFTSSAFPVLTTSGPFFLLLLISDIPRYVWAFSERVPGNLPVAFPRVVFLIHVGRFCQGGIQERNPEVPQKKPGTNTGLFRAFDDKMELHFRLEGFQVVSPQLAVRGGMISLSFH